MIEFTSSNEPLWKGHLFALSLLVVSAFQTILVTHNQYYYHLVGMRIRTALISTIYKKSLRMSIAARKEFTVGEIVNLMSVDAQRFKDVVYLNELVNAPVQITVAIYFLWGMLGVATLSGVLVLLLLIPINSIVIKMETTLEIQQMENKDSRMKSTNEILTGIKVLKLVISGVFRDENCWLTYFVF